MIKLDIVSKENKELAKNLQAEIFSNEKSPNQIETGIKTGNPLNYIAYNDNKPIGIIGFYFQENLSEHLLLNWYGVIKQERRKGYGKDILLKSIKLAKSIYPNKKYVTLYTEKKANKIAIKLYKKLGFKLKKYNNKEDVKNLKKLHVKNDFVIGIFPLKNDKLPNFEAINLNISKQLSELKNYN